MSQTSDYLDKITPYHRGKPRFTQTVAESVAPMVDEQAFLHGLPLAFDVDTAIGAQLDVVGEWVGRSRYIPTPLDDLWFSFDIARKGFDKGIWKGPYASGIGFTRLDDVFYRRLLKAKILCNAWNGTATAAQAILNAFFADQTRGFVEDRCIAVGRRDGVNADASVLDMSCFIVVAGALPPAIQLLILGQNLLPLKPAGTTTYYLMTSVNNAPVFGFDVDNSYIGGFDHGSHAIPMGRMDLVAA
jgi:hypothetical protein